jgi:hypothetical protein
VGDSQVPLLRIVDASGAPGAVLCKSFDQLRYTPVQQRHFDSITLDIRDAFGEPILFETGTLVVTLHFRKAEVEYFL